MKLGKKWLALLTLAAMMVMAFAPAAEASVSWPYSLTVNVEPDGAGSVTEDWSSWWYGQRVYLTPEANEGWEFSHWSKNVDWSDFASSHYVIVNGHKTVTAYFTQTSTTLDVTVSPEGSGTVTVDPEKEEYDPEDVVTLTPVPNSGYRFVGWGGCDGEDVTEENTLSMDSDRAVEAQFEEIPHRDPAAEGSLTATVVKTDGGDVDGIPVSFGGDLSATINTNASGVAKVNGLWAGDYTVNAADAGYTSDGPKSVELERDDSTASVKITLTPLPPAPPEPGPGAIEGKASDGTTLAVLPGVLVRLLDSTDTMVGMDMTDPAGEFGFEGLVPGQYTVRGSLDGYGAETEVAVVVHDATTEVALELAATIVVPPTPPATEPIETPPDLPKTGAVFVGWLVLGGIVAGAGLLGRKRF